MSAIARFHTDKQLEKDGIWIDYGEFQIKIARAGDSNPRYVQRRESLMRPLRRQIDNGTLSREKQDEILKQLFCECVVLDWKGAIFSDDPEENVPCTIDAVTDLVEKAPDLYADLLLQATDYKLFLKQAAEADAKS